MKRIKIVQLFALFIGLTSLSSCLKKDSMNIDTEETTSTIMELQFIENGSGSTINSGMQYFAGGALTYPSSEDEHIANFNVSLAGPVTLGGDLKVTIGIDESKKLDNFSSDSIAYDIMPDSLYDFVSTEVTVKAGERIAPFQIKFYPSKVNPAYSYMLPVVIKDAQGKIISGNFGTLYLHIIGNPLAGNYTQEYTRYNTPDPVGSPLIHDFYDAIFSPVNPTTIAVESGTGVIYKLTFKNSAGVFSDFKVTIDAASVTAAGITIASGPTISIADPATSTFEFKYIYANSSGALRNITDKYTR